MERIEKDDERRIVFAVSPADEKEGARPTLIVGIPAASLAELLASKANSAHVEACGLNLNVVVFVGQTRDHCKAVIIEAASGNSPTAVAHALSDIEKGVGP